MKSMKKVIGKKGFTLVELIVVVAIIAVLAAVLIPTMIGAVREARVNSANTAASSIREKMNIFLTKADIECYGLGTTPDSNARLDITVTDKTWQITTTGKEKFCSVGTLKWVGSGSAVASDTNPDTAEKALAINMANIFTDMNNASIVAYLSAGKVAYVAYAENVTTADIIASDGTPAVLGGGTEPYRAPDDDPWGGTAGYTQKGFVCGTSPIVALRRNA